MYAFEKLKPCPFCNSAACIETGNKNGDVVFYVHCRKCGLQTERYIAKDNTDKELGNIIRNIFIAWNMRQEDKNNGRNST